MNNPFLRLLEQHPLVFVHMLAAVGALAVGAVVLARRKGTTSHRATGWLWVALMGTAALSSAFIRDSFLPNIGGITPIHVFTVLVAWQLPVAVMRARRGNIEGHRAAMRGLYIGGCIVAGLFTLVPGRFLGTQLMRLLA